MATVEQIREAQMRARSLGARGIRILSPDHADYGRLIEGRGNLTPSHSWTDRGEDMGEMDGVCALSTSTRIRTSYPGNEIVILDAQRWEDGEDDGEIIMPCDSYVVEVYRV